MTAISLLLALTPDERRERIRDARKRIEMAEEKRRDAKRERDSKAETKRAERKAEAKREAKRQANATTRRLRPSVRPRRTAEGHDRRRGRDVPKNQSTHALAQVDRSTEKSTRK